MIQRFQPTDCGECRAAIYRRLNKIVAASILAQGQGYDELRAWAFVGHVAREIQGDLLRMSSAEAAVINQSLKSPNQSAPWGRKNADEGSHMSEERA